MRRSNSDTHVSAAHPVTYKITEAPKKTIAATLVYKNAAIVEFKLQTGLGQKFRVENATGKDVDEILNSGVLSGSRSGQIAFRVTAASNKATTSEAKLKAGPYTFTVGQDVPIDQVLADVKATIETPGKLLYNFDPKEITLQPFVRFDDPGYVADRPISFTRRFRLHHCLNRYRVDKSYGPKGADASHDHGCGADL